MFGSDPQPTRSGGLQFYPNSNGYGYVQRDIIGPGGKKLPKFIVPHVELFTGIVGGLSTYRWRFDEALKHSRENALAMRRDTFIDACLRERKLAAAQLSWDITPENPVDPVQLEVANAVKSRISLIPDLEGLFMQSLESVWYGRAASHILWDEDDERGMRITDHYPINGDKLVFTYEGIPGILVHATAPLPDDAEIIFSERNRALLLSNPFWRERFLISIHEKIDADFYEPEFAGQRWGIGLRNYVYWYWWLLQEVMGWVIDFVEKVGLGVTVFYYEQGNKEAKSAAEDASKKQSRNTVLVLPRPIGQEKAGSGVERLEIPVVGAEFLLKVVETYFKDAIRQCINGQTLSAHAESTGLGSGVASLHGSTKDKIALSDSKRLGEALTRDIVFVDQRWNHKGTEKKFRLKWVFQQGRSDADRAMAAARAIFDMGGKLKESELLSIANLTAPAEGEKALERLDPTVNKDIFQMQMQMQQQAAAAQQQGAAGGSQYTDYSGPRVGQGRKNLQTGRIEYGKHLQAETLGQLHQNLKQEYAQGQPAQFGRTELPLTYANIPQGREDTRDSLRSPGAGILPPEIPSAEGKSPVSHPGEFFPDHETGDPVHISSPRAVPSILKSARNLALAQEPEIGQWRTAANMGQMNQEDYSRFHKKVIGGINRHAVALWRAYGVNPEGRNDFEDLAREAHSQGGNSLYRNIILGEPDSVGEASVILARYFENILGRHRQRAMNAITKMNVPFMTEDLWNRSEEAMRGEREAQADMLEEMGLSTHGIRGGESTSGDRPPVGYSRERGVQLKDFEDQRERAHEAGLVQLPPGGKGAMCGNCLFMQRHGDNAEGYCQHPKVKQRVHTDWCCNHYDSKGTIHFEKAQKTVASVLHGEVQSLLDEIRGIVRPEHYANVPQGTGSTYLERPPTARGAEMASAQRAPEVASPPFVERATEKGPFAGYNQMFDERAKKLHGAIADPAARESLHGMIGSHDWIGDMGTVLKSTGTHPSDVEDQIQNHAFRWLGAESPLFSQEKFTGGNFKHYWNSFLRTMGKHGREGAGMGKKIGALESDVLTTPLERGTTGIAGIADTKSISPEEDMELQEGLKNAEDIWRKQDESGDRDRVLQVVQKLLGKGGGYKVSDVIPRVIKTHPHMNAASIRKHIGSLMEEGKLDTGPLDRPFSELSGQKVPDEEKVLRAAQRLIESGKESFTPYQIRRSVANRSPHLTTEVIGGILDKLRSEGKLPEKFDKLPGGKGDDRPDSDFDPEQLASGIKHEMEHTNDPSIAKEIAKDHLTEDCDYYKKLKKMEEGNG